MSRSDSTHPTLAVRIAGFGIAMAAIVAVPDLAAQEARIDRKTCTIVVDGKTFPLAGRVQFVEHFPDFTVRYVDAFADLHVRTVTAFPDECGKWQIVESFPDFKVKIVASFENLRIRSVEAFPGLQRP